MYTTQHAPVSLFCLSLCCVWLLAQSPSLSTDSQKVLCWPWLGRLRHGRWQLGSYLLQQQFNDENSALSTRPAEYSMPVWSESRHSVYEQRFLDSQCETAFYDKRFVCCLGLIARELTYCEKHCDCRQHQHQSWIPCFAFGMWGSVSGVGNL